MASRRRPCEIRRTENLMICGSSSVFEYKRKWKFSVVLFNFHYAINYSRGENDELLFLLRKCSWQRRLSVGS